MDFTFNVGDYVHIIPIDEHGTVCKVRYDDHAMPIYTVDLRSGFGLHLCRHQELAIASVEEDNG